MISPYFLRPLRTTDIIIMIGGWVICSGSASHAASVVLDAQPLANLNITSGAIVPVVVDFSAATSISGFGLTADWTAVVADQEDGLYPWSLDLRITGTSPLGTQLVWDPIGGDVTIADYPLADFSGNYALPQPSGNYTLAFSTPGVPSPYVSGLRAVTAYALGSAPDVTTDYDGTVTTGPTWNRPFYINGISGLGPVVYDVVVFTVPQSGGYSFESIVPSGNNFNFLYRGNFDPNLPLENLLDYGLGNGNAPNGTPQGTSLIESLLLSDETYYYVTSQFDRFTPGQSFETTITGPAPIQPISPHPSGDFDGDGDYACHDVDALVAEIVRGTNDGAFDLTGDALVNQDDLAAWLAEAGAAELPSGNTYLLGDADLSGTVDGVDFIAWNANKFSVTAAWCSGDFNADGFVDGSDFVLWNQFKFQSAATAVVPEPIADFVLATGLLTVLATRRWMG